MRWSTRRDPEQGAPRKQRPVVAPVLLAAAIAGSLAGWAPEARAATCEIPLASQQGSEATPAGSGGSPAPDIIQIEGASSATPATLPAATPIAEQEPAEAADPLADDLTAVSEALAACLSAGEYEMVTDLAGERYLGQIFGSSVPFSREDYLAIASELRPVPTRILALEDAEQTAEGQATAVVTQVVGNQVMRAEWQFAEAPRDARAAGESRWQLASERSLSVDAPRAAETIEVGISGTSFTLDPSTVAGPDVILRGENRATVDHEMLVLRFADGFTADDLLRPAGPDLPAEVTYIGQMSVRAGDAADLVLIDLEPGAYTIVCLFSDEDGLPYLARGMAAEFTVG